MTNASFERRILKFSPAMTCTMTVMTKRSIQYSPNWHMIWIEIPLGMDYSPNWQRSPINASGHLRNSNELLDSHWWPEGVCARRKIELHPTDQPSTSHPKSFCSQSFLSFPWKSKQIPKCSKLCAWVNLTRCHHIIQRPLEDRQSSNRPHNHNNRGLVLIMPPHQDQSVRCKFERESRCPNSSLQSQWK